MSSIAFCDIVRKSAFSLFRVVNVSINEYVG